MQGYVANIKDLTTENENFRKVLYTAPNMQLVVMSLNPGEDIGLERHKDVDQFIRIEEGKGKAILAGEEHMIEDDWVVIIPAGLEHNIANTGEGKMKLYTLYSPPEHPIGTLQETKEEAEEEES